MFPETAGKSLEEVESMFLDPHGARYLGTSPWRTHVVKNALGGDRMTEKGEKVMHREGGSDSHVSDEEAQVIPPMANKA